MSSFLNRLGFGRSSAELQKAKDAFIARHMILESDRKLIKKAKNLDELQAVINDIVSRNKDIRPEFEEYKRAKKAENAAILRSEDLAQIDEAFSSGEVQNIIRSRMISGVKTPVRSNEEAVPIELVSPRAAPTTEAQAFLEEEEKAEREEQASSDAEKSDPSLAPLQLAFNADADRYFHQVRQALEDRPEIDGDIKTAILKMADQEAANFEQDIQGLTGDQLQQATDRFLTRAANRVKEIRESSRVGLIGMLSAAQVPSTPASPLQSAATESVNASDTASNSSNPSSGQATLLAEGYSNDGLSEGSTVAGEHLSEGSTVAGEQQIPAQNVVDGTLTGQAVQFSGKGAQYHKIPIMLFFNNIETPNWDLQLNNDIDSLNLSPEDCASIMDMIISVNGPKILVSQRQSSSVQETKEILQLHFCLERHLANGSRTAGGFVPLKQLFSLYGAANGMPTSATEPDLAPDSAPETMQGLQGPNLPPVAPVEGPKAALAPEEYEKLWDNRKFNENGPSRPQLFYDVLNIPIASAPQDHFGASSVQRLDPVDTNRMPVNYFYLRRGDDDEECC